MADSNKESVERTIREKNWYESDREIQHGHQFIPDCCINCRVLASSGGVQYCESMSELSFSTFVAVHGQDQFAGWANDAPGTLDEGTTKGPNLPEAP